MKRRREDAIEKEDYLNRTPAAVLASPNMQLAQPGVAHMWHKPDIHDTHGDGEFRSRPPLPSPATTSLF